MSWRIINPVNKQYELSVIGATFNNAYVDCFSSLLPQNQKRGIMRYLDTIFVALFVGGAITLTQISLADELKQNDRLGVSLNQAIPPEDQDAEAHYNRGIEYFILQQYDRALTEFNQALTLNPQLVDAYINRGNTYAHLQQYDKALANYNQALALNPQDGLAYYNRGLAYHELGNISQTKKDWQKAASLFRQQNNIQLYQSIQQELQLL